MMEQSNQTPEYKSIQIVSKHILKQFGTTQLRCIQPFEYLQFLGAKVFLGRLYKSIPKQQSIIIIHRALLDAYTDKFIQYAKLSGSVLVYSTDDLIFDDIDKNYLNQINNARLAENITLHKQAMKCCDVIIVSTDYLKEKAELFHDDVRVIKNALSFEFFRQAEYVFNTKKNNDQMVTLAYLSGSNSHDNDFLVIQDALLRLLCEFSNLRLLVVGKLNVSKKFNLFSDQCEFRDFLPYEQFPHLFTEIDINLIPLDLAQSFCHAKSELKYIEAGVCGVPSVASPTSVHKQVIYEMENGLLAEDYEWFDKLKNLVIDKDLRNNLGNKAREHVLECYSPEQRVKQWQDFVEDIWPIYFCSKQQHNNIEKTSLRMILELTRLYRIARILLSYLGLKKLNFFKKN